MQTRSYWQTLVLLADTIPGSVTIMLLLIPVLGFLTRGMDHDDVVFMLVLFIAIHISSDAHKLRQKWDLKGSIPILVQGCWAAALLAAYVLYTHFVSPR